MLPLSGRCEACQWATCGLKDCLLKLAGFGGFAEAAEDALAWSVGAGWAAGGAAD